jgi:DNA repair protein RecN (Recombination protein N)
MESEAQSIGNLDGEITACQEELASIGQRLSRLRSRAARRLRGLIEGQFRDLDMHEAAFQAEIRSRAPEDPAVDSSGFDEMEFLVRTNPGHEFLPLRKIASGGEISRIMLALKTVLADRDRVSVLVFDEIDANIGDRFGATIGRKMSALAHGQRVGWKEQCGSGCQVICITHLSQIAACADRHIRVAKETIGPADSRQTVAKVGILDAEERIGELAEMMAGRSATEATVAHARDLLGQNADVPPRRQRQPAQSRKSRRRRPTACRRAS